DAADAHGQEVARMESEVQAERKRWAEEELAEGVAADRVAQLSEERSRVLEERGALMINLSAEAGRFSAVTDQLQHVRAETRVVEQRFSAAMARTAEAQRRAREASLQGEMRATKVKGMIADVWQSARAAAVEAGAGGAAFAPPPRLPR
ncbi:unnamed protein product, partial [Prorocentrum cordatum]